MLSSQRIKSIWVMSIAFLVSFALRSLKTVEAADAQEYLVGVGIADITGPVGGAKMAGYAKDNQTTKGIHTRLFARSFMFDSRDEPNSRVVFVSADLAMIGQALKVEVRCDQIGNLYIAGMPGELTTMSGRRIRAAIKTIANTLDKDAVIVIAGLSNVYTHYVTTFEEYQIQRYEGGSTMYGPNTLNAYIQQYSRLTESMLNKNTVLDDGPTPALLLERQIPSIPVIIFDVPPFLKKFGDCVQEPKQLASPGDTITVKFVSGHPRNNLMRSRTFFAVEKKSDSGSWTTVANDADWCTTFTWIHTGALSPNHEVEIKWVIPVTQGAGTYRIRSFGYAKMLLIPVPYEGVTKEFKIGKRVPALFQHGRHPPPSAEFEINTI